VGAILTALIREERLQINHVSATPPSPGRRSGSPRTRQILIDPYTLLVYKKGLYLTPGAACGFYIGAFSLRTTPCS
jgi:hypothetical protein